MNCYRRLLSCWSHRRATTDYLLSVGILLLTLTLGACAGERSWEVRGRVVGFGDDGRTVFVAHENIPGLMPAMTMPFATHPHELEGLEHGDPISFVLHANADSSWIDRLAQLAADAPPLVLEEEAHSDSSTRVPVLSIGDRLPEVSLVNHDGQPFEISDYRGRFVLLQFIYTRCPLPDFCPWMVRRFIEIREMTDAEGAPPLIYVSVTLDPDYDTPDVLKRYAEEKVDSLDGWWFATGAPDEINRLASALGVTYTESGEEIVHSLGTALIDTSGTFAGMWRGNAWQSRDVLDRIRHLNGQ